MKPFTMLKFRTMHVNVDHKLHQDYMAQFIKTGDESGEPDHFFKIKNDPRVTPVGRFLPRRVSTNCRNLERAPRRHVARRTSSSESPTSSNSTSPALSPGLEAKPGITDSGSDGTQSDNV